MSVIGQEAAGAVLVRLIVLEAGKEGPVPAIASEVPADHSAAISAARIPQEIASVVCPAVPICREVREAHPVAAAAAQVAAVVVSRDDK